MRLTKREEHLYFNDVLFHRLSNSISSLIYENKIDKDDLMDCISVAILKAKERNDRDKHSLQDAVDTQRKEIEAQDRRNRLSSEIPTQDD